MTKAIRPNMFIVLLDDVPFDVWTNSAGLNQLSAGYGGNWLNFPNSTLNLPSCGPSRASTFSGQRSAHTGVLYTSATGGGGTGADFRWDTTIWRLLRRAGYSVGGFGKLMNSYNVNPAKLPGGFTHFSFMDSPSYYNYTIVENGVSQVYAATSAEYSTDVYKNKILAWLAAQAASPKDPWCVYWAPNCPHPDGVGGPTPAPRHTSLSVTLTRDPSFNEPDISDKPSWLKSYRPTPLDAGQITNLDTDHINAIRTLRSFDEAMVAIMDYLTSIGQLDNTVIMVWGDNGHVYGEHRLAGKGVGYRVATDMQLRIRWPGATPADRTQLLSNIDIAPTLAELAGIDIPWAVDGMSFLPVLQSASAPYRRSILSEYFADDANSPSFNRARWVDRAITLYGSGEYEGYNLLTDPYELRNIGASSQDLTELQKLIDLS